MTEIQNLVFSKAHEIFDQMLKKDQIDIKKSFTICHKIILEKTRIELHFKFLKNGAFYNRYHGHTHESLRNMFQKYVFQKAHEKS